MSNQTREEKNSIISTSLQEQVKIHYVVWVFEGNIMAYYATACCCCVALVYLVFWHRREPGRPTNKTNRMRIVEALCQVNSVAVLLLQL